jgi:hypothetical protein
MTICYPTVDVLMDFGAGLTSVAADVLITRGTLNASWGSTACDPMTRIATTGQFVFTLDNSEYNSGTKLGYYSPGNSNLRSGFTLETPVVLKITYGGVSKFKRFYISNITPAAGIHSTRQTDIIAADIFGRLATQIITGLAVQVSKRVDQGLATLLGLLPTAPLATALSVAPETQSYLFTDITDSTQFMTAVQHLALTDAGYIFCKGDASGGETFTYENRQERQMRASSLTITGTMTGLNAPTNENQILNDIIASVYPGAVGANPETVYSQAKELTVHSGATMTIQANYNDPGAGNGTPNTVIIVPGSGVTPVAGTDYKVALISGSGANDAVAYLTVTVTWNASYASIVLTNLSTSFDIFVNPFVLRARIIRLYNQQDARIRDTAPNYAQYGVRPLSYPMYYQDDVNFATDMANHWFSMWHLPTSIPQYVEFIANNDTAQMAAAVSLDIGDKITISEAVTGVNSDYNIMGVEMTIANGSTLTVRYYLEPANLVPQFILDDSTYGVLDTGPGRLAF